jgi:16S rRNA (uracil1498-N3)-methyltransferase
VTTPVFVATTEQLNHASVVLEGGEAHHAAASRRLRVGERVVVTDGLGTAATGTIVDAARSRVVVEVERRETQPAATPRVTIVQAIPKGERAELAVELMTEVGVDTIVPFAAARCVVRWDAERAERGVQRWRTTAREAAKQSRRWWFPDVTEVARLADVARLVNEADLALVLHEVADLPVSHVAVPDDGHLVLVVGPEGGLADDEVTTLVDAGAHAVRLGPTVLRSSTAGVVAATALLSRTPRWSRTP